VPFGLPVLEHIIIAMEKGEIKKGRNRGLVDEMAKLVNNRISKMDTGGIIIS
jgi:hypothetical protein